MGARPALRQRFVQAILARFWDDPIFVSPVKGSSSKRRTNGLYTIVHGDVAGYCDVTTWQFRGLHSAFFVALTNHKYGHVLFLGCLTLLPNEACCWHPV
jgi:hypothetical protein